MENTKVKKYFDKLSEESRNILVAIIEDSLAYLDSQELITTTELGRLASFYFVLIDYKHKGIIEFDGLKEKEKQLIFKIILDGIASIYVDNEYLEYSDIGTKYKEVIIQELLSFFRFISRYTKEKVFMLYELEVKKYRRKDFNWDSNLIDE